MILLHTDLSLLCIGLFDTVKAQFWLNEHVRVREQCDFDSVV